MPATRPLHLAAEIGGPPRYDAASHVALARLAEGGALDFVTLRDSFARPGLDAAAVLARVAPETARVGLVPTLTTTHTEPFHVSSAVATLDWVSRGRAGWHADVSTTEAEARLFGRRPAAPAPALWQEAGEVADVVARLWDSWEDDAEIRSVATGRFVDRDKLHHIDFEGSTFSVKGPAIVPRPPQGRPVTVIDATTAPAGRVAARHADVVYVRASSPEQAAALRAEVHRSAARHGRDPQAVRVLVALTVDLGDAETAPEPGLESGPQLAGHGTYFRGGPVDLAELITQWYRAGAVDGFHLTPLSPARDLERIVNGTVALLQHRSLFRTFYPGGTLREHLGLTRPANRYAAPRTEAAS
ncbi:MULTISPECIES: LLM class flavin-dependent oxidoreductase [unclassified Streptomyces]|uniref:LLM class flavin-dependent oxidoreductase n=1 Tax=unclassified Streptomyces TaxID=2593676 RepID=UPI0004764C93|nr:MULTISPECIES: LLM class flavin-dependent oxidoreductase [unclassified Streptomyces]MYR68940.1 LLM class flavin-dependent oxidoreductase [Streptomyces sp. SID4939]MYS01322.1 LLM class flavin-dependent oxidoreductase [Streptomyces sp. SID4940]MYT62480.1 LLM class flavin-dependent oxidoreductase [Streptomyces sp. SID8357]MYT85482.1 LLM class flavin-dependent oxidoreductase [Streptomyces sp. SID8360]MYW36583.1 LLM class flavin-dependent oxidoreductase [Streptomyces sp. SID1]